MVSKAQIVTRTRTMSFGIRGIVMNQWEEAIEIAPFPGDPTDETVQWKQSVIIFYLNSKRHWASWDNLQLAQKCLFPANIKQIKST